MSKLTSNIIQNAIDHNKLSHAYLFYGDKGADIEKHILIAIKTIMQNCGFDTNFNNLKEANYIDLKIIEPTKSDVDKQPQIKKEDVDQAIVSLLETSLVKNAKKILYIKDVNLGNKYSLNRLLKFVEEPTDNLIIFMSTNNFDNVISTIKSRTQNIFIKHESLKEKMESFKNVDPKHYALLANLFANIDQVKELNLKEFNNIYENIITTFKDGSKNKYLIKNRLNKIWTKQNSDLFLDIIQLFFYQVMIDNNNLIFANEKELINFYKNKKINAFDLLILIDQAKKNIARYTIFNLQKINLLNYLEEIL